MSGTPPAACEQAGRQDGPCEAAAAVVPAGNSISSAFSWLWPQPNTEERQTTAKVAKAYEIIVCCCFTQFFFSFYRVCTMNTDPLYLRTAFSCHSLLAFVSKAKAVTSFYGFICKYDSSMCASVLLWSLSVIMEPQSQYYAASSLLVALLLCLCLNQTRSPCLTRSRGEQKPADLSDVCERCSALPS